MNENNVDARIVIDVLRQTIADLQWEITLLKAQRLSERETPIAEPVKEADDAH
jgi:hypothetical protein